MPSQSQTPRRRFIHYSLAAAGVIAAVLVSLALPALGIRPTIGPLFLLAVMAGAWWGGYGPGLLATFLTVVVVPLLFVPGFSIVQMDVAQAGGLALISVLISWARATRARTEQSLRDAAATLERRIHERTQELGRSERKFRALIENSADAIAVVDREGKVLYASASTARVLGFTAEEFAGSSGFDLVHPDDMPNVLGAMADLLAQPGKIVRVEVRVRRKDGEWRWMESTGTNLPEDPDIGGIVSNYRDITERKQWEESLRDRDDRLRVALTAASAGTWRWDIDADRDTCDASLNRLLGLGPVETTQPLEVSISRVHPDDREMVRRAMRAAVEEGADYDIAFRIVWPDGTVRWLRDVGRVFRDENGRARYMTGASADVTEHHQTEEKLRHTQKLESLGVLAGGIAHDFNNLLTGMLGNASLASELVSPSSPVRELLENVVKAAQRAGDLTRQLLAYAGKGRFILQAVNFSELVGEISGLLQASIPKNVHLRLEVEPNMPPVEADPGQMQQLVMNLVINAAEAIPDGQSGSVAVRTGVQEVDDAYIRQHFVPGELRAGRHVFLEVHDTGAGMDEATKARIFDPFFTTKFTGRGLGLAAVQGIVRGHKGALRVYSAPGQGSTFKVLFPASGEDTARPTQAEEARQLRGMGIVLVVDDEEAVRTIAKRALEHYGYTVLLAQNGRIAVEIFRQRSAEIALVLLDLTMPEMSGDETLRQLQTIRRDVKVILSSGYNEAETVLRFAGKGLEGFIQKPYTGKQLAEKVKMALARTR